MIRFLESRPSWKLIGTAWSDAETLAAVSEKTFDLLLLSDDVVLSDQTARLLASLPILKAVVVKSESVTALRTALQIKAEGVFEIPREGKKWARGYLPNWVNRILLSDKSSPFGALKAGLGPA